MRYIAKVLPALIAGTIAGCLELSQSDNLSNKGLSNKGLLRMTWISAIMTIAWQVAGLTAYQD